MDTTGLRKREGQDEEEQPGQRSILLTEDRWTFRGAFLATRHLSISMQPSLETWGGLELRHVGLVEYHSQKTPARDSGSCSTPPPRELFPTPQLSMGNA